MKITRAQLRRVILKEMKLAESLQSTSEALYSAMEDYVDAVANSTDYDPAEMLRDQVEGFIESYDFDEDESWADPDGFYADQNTRDDS